MHIHHGGDTPLLPATIPAVRPFEVWFKPDDGVHLPSRIPLRIGCRMVHYDDAVSLAEAAARELPAYGVTQGTVLVIWHASILKVLNTVPLPAAPTQSRAFPLGIAVGRPRREVARLVL